MKKTYINPAMEIVKLKSMELLAGSVQAISDETPQEWGAHEDEFEF